MPSVHASDPLVRAFAAHLEDTQRIARGDRLLLAVSGGVGSTALAALLTSQQKTQKLTLTLGHCRASAAAERTARDLAAVLRLPLDIVDPDPHETADFLDIPPHLEALRVKRAARFVVTGHTRDHVEADALLAFLDGGSVDELTGIRPVSGDTLRPLLPFAREECRTFLDRAELPAHRDPARLSPASPLDRMRLFVLPLLRHHVTPNLSGTLATVRRLAGDDAAFLRELAHAARAEASWAAGPEGITLARTTHLRLPPALRRRILGDALREAAAAAVPAPVLQSLDAEIATGGDTPRTIGTAPWRITLTGDTLLVHRV